MQTRLGGDGEPLMAPFPYNDYGSGNLAAYAVLLALFARMRGGAGQHVQSSLAHAGTFLQVPFMVASPGRAWDEPRGQQAKGWNACDRLYRAADRWFYLAAPQGLGALPDLAGLDGRKLEETFRTERAAAWVGRLHAAGIGAHILTELTDMMDDDVARARGLSLEREHRGVGRVRMAGPSARLSRTPPRPTRPGPPGSDTRSVLEDLGFDAGDLIARDITVTGCRRQRASWGCSGDRSSHLPAGCPDRRIRRTAGCDHRRPGRRAAPWDRGAPAAEARHQPRGGARGAAEPAGPGHRLGRVPLGAARAALCPGQRVHGHRNRLRPLPGRLPGLRECHASPTSPGAFATQVLVGDEDLLPLPDGVDPVLTAAVGNSGTAAFMPLIEDAGLRTGETVLVLGATGAVGQLAVQVARQHAAGRVIGAGRNRAALEHVLALGADAVIDLRPGEGEDELADRLIAAAGPVNVVLDGLFGLPLQAALRVCAPRARVVNIGNLAGATAQLPAGLLRGKQLTVSGFAGLHTPLRDKQAALTWLWGALAAGTLRIGIRTFPLGELGAAWTEQAASPHAKCVVLAEEDDVPARSPCTPIRDDRSNRP